MFLPPVLVNCILKKNSALLVGRLPFLVLFHANVRIIWFCFLSPIMLQSWMKLIKYETFEACINIFVIVYSQDPKYQKILGLSSSTHTFICSIQMWTFPKTSPIAYVRRSHQIIHMNPIRKKYILTIQKLIPIARNI